jgi:hypothetical protein
MELPKRSASADATFSIPDKEAEADFKYLADSAAEPYFQARYAVLKTLSASATGSFNRVRQLS